MARRLDLVCAAPIALLVVASTIGLAAHLLPGKDFWWDEAGQYWMAQGQMHLSQAGTSPQALVTGLNFGRNGFNLDPVGFTVLLRIWIEVWGIAPIALRALPFAFYVIAYLVAVAFGGWLRLPWVINLSLPFAVLGTELPLRFSVELRAFSLEMLAVLVTGALTVLAVSRPTATCFSMLALSFIGFGISTRYSYVVAIIGSLCVVATMALLQSDKNLLRLSLIPVIASAVTAVILAWNIGLFGGGRQASPSYTDALEFAGSWSPDFVVSSLRDNFATGAHLLTGSFLIIGLVRMLRDFKQRHGAVDLLSTWPPIFLFALWYEVVAAGVSVAGLSPWNAAWRWSIGLSAIAILSGFGLSRMVADCSMERLGRWRRSNQVAVVTGVIVFCSIATLFTAARLFAFQRINLQPVNEAMLTVQQRVGSTPLTWLVAADQWPTFRMLVETDALGDLPRPANYSMLGSAASSGGVTPVFFSSDASTADGLPPTVACDAATATVVLLPFATNEFPETLEGLGRLGFASGCTIEVIDLGSTGSAILLRHNGG